MSDYQAIPPLPYEPAPPTDFHPVTTRPSGIEPRERPPQPRVLSVLNDPDNEDAVLISYSQPVSIRRTAENIAAPNRGHSVHELPIDVGGLTKTDFDVPIGSWFDVDRGLLWVLKVVFNGPVSGRPFIYRSNDPTVTASGQMVLGLRGQLPIQLDV